MKTAEERAREVVDVWWTDDTTTIALVAKRCASAIEEACAEARALALEEAARICLDRRDRWQTWATQQDRAFAANVCATDIRAAIRSLPGAVLPGPLPTKERA